MDSPRTAEWIADVLARFEAPLLRFATKLLRGDGERARDVVQETFLQLCAQRREEVEAHLAAWLYRVCRNRAIDLVRKDNRVEPIEHRDAADPYPNPAQLAAHREGASQVLSILESLPDSHREAVYLRFQSGLSYKEISEVTGHSVSHVGVILHTAVKKVREHLMSTAIMTRTAEGSR
jgi:RNA polymerase sigma-70 factor (ECF subfamily)